MHQQSSISIWCGKSQGQLPLDWWGQRETTSNALWSHDDLEQQTRIVCFWSHAWILLLPYTSTWAEVKSKFRPSIWSGRSALFTSGNDRSFNDAMINKFQHERYLAENTERWEMRVQVTRSCEDQELIERRTIKFEEVSQGASCRHVPRREHQPLGLGLGTGGRWLGPAEIGKSLETPKLNNDLHSHHSHIWQEASRDLPHVLCKPFRLIRAIFVMEEVKREYTERWGRDAIPRAVIVRCCRHSLNIVQ